MAMPKLEEGLPQLLLASLPPRRRKLRNNKPRRRRRSLSPLRSLNPLTRRKTSDWEQDYSTDSNRHIQHYHQEQWIIMRPWLVKPSFLQNQTLLYRQKRFIIWQSYFQPMIFSISMIALPQPLPRTDLQVTMFQIFPSLPRTVAQMIMVPVATSFLVCVSQPTMTICFEWDCRIFQSCAMKAAFSGFGALDSWISNSQSPLLQSSGRRYRNYIPGYL